MGENASMSDSELGNHVLPERIHPARAVLIFKGRSSLSLP